MVKVIAYHALAAGPTLTVLGAVHGNERCGAAAIGRLVADIDAGTVKLERGTVQLVPVTNPRAYAEGVRFVERNLNRHLYPKAERVHYEDHLDPILCGVLDKTDVLLDLHSYAAQGGPFIFLGGHNPAEIAYARALGVSDFVCGWAEAFGSVDAGLESQGTTEYARSKGALAVTLECGNHTNPDAPGTGYRNILLAMAHLGMTEVWRSEIALRPTEQRCVRMENVYRREKGAEFVKPWRHFDAVAKGEPIATLAGGGILAAPEDGFLILPNGNSPFGVEWFYFGTKTEFPA